MRVSLDECAELAAGVSAGPEHADWCFIHTQCIIIHRYEVNGACGEPWLMAAKPFQNRSFDDSETGAPEGHPAARFGARDRQPGGAQAAARRTRLVRDTSDAIA